MKMYCENRKDSTFSTVSTKSRRTTEAIFTVKVEGNLHSLLQTSFEPEIEISVNLNEIYGTKENHPTPGIGSFMDLLHDGVWSRQLKVERGSKVHEQKVVGHLFLFCKWMNPPVTSIPQRWGADFLIEVKDFNDIFKDATAPRIWKNSRIFRLIKKLLVKNNYGHIERIDFLGYH
jgi:hypothetical protein